MCPLPVLTFALTVLLSAAPSARQLVDDAQKAYAKGDYPEAARLLEAASKQDPSGRILFNLARALEKANEVEKAIVIYETYLDRPDAELQAMKRARKALAALYRLKPATPKEEPKAVVEPPPPPEEKPVALTPVEPVKEVVAPPPAVVVTPVVESGSRPLRIAGIVGLISGGVVAGVGVGLGLWTQGTAAQARASLDPTLKPQLVSQTLSRATFTDIAWVTAAGLVVTGAVLFLVDVFTR
ncbi:MAG: tetratricopeptide repeat protein [Archangium sp.]|nr:tetratricopeptide repeat protein [Archangium sp.]